MLSDAEKDNNLSGNCPRCPPLNPALLPTAHFCFTSPLEFLRYRPLWEPLLYMHQKGKLFELEDKEMKAFHGINTVNLG